MKSEVSRINGDANKIVCDGTEWIYIGGIKCSTPQMDLFYFEC